MLPNVLTRELVDSFGKYVVVGVIGTAIHFLSTILLVELIGWEPTPASALGFVLTLLVSFLLNSRWTFQLQSTSALMLVKYVFVSVSGLVINIFIMYTTTELLLLSYLFGLSLVVIVIPPYNFLLNLIWTFRRQ